MSNTEQIAKLTEELKNINKDVHPEDYERVNSQLSSLLSSLKDNYKVYSALLSQQTTTQSSGPLIIGHSYNPISGLGDFSDVGQRRSGSVFVAVSSQIAGLLIVGHRYKIILYFDGDDFTNVGAASNATDIEFIATGTTPAVWTNVSKLSDMSITEVTPLDYGDAVLMDLTASAPQATVLENTLDGNIVWSYENVGTYKGSAFGVLPLGKTIIPNNMVDCSGESGSVLFDTCRYLLQGDLEFTDSWNILIFANEWSIAENINTLSDNLMYNSPIEIRVYN